MDQRKVQAIVERSHVVKLVFPDEKLFAVFRIFAKQRIWVFWVSYQPMLWLLKLDSQQLTSPRA